MKQLLLLVIESLVRDLGRAVILIGGTGCVGKSVFSEELRNHLRSALKSAVSILDLDCYLIERVIRESGPQIISGYNPAGYELSRAICDIESLLDGKAICVSPYDKVTSQRTRKIQVDPAEILIIEGAMALTERMREFGNIRIFFDAEPEIEYENRVARERKLGFDRERTERKFAHLLKDHKKFIASQSQFADILVNVGAQYEFLNVEMRGHLNQR